MIFFTACTIFFFKKKIITINPQIIKTQVHKCTYDHWRECGTPITIDMCYGLIPQHSSNIANPITPSKPRLHGMFGSNMMKNTFTSASTRVR